MTQAARVSSVTGERWFEAPEMRSLFAPRLSWVRRLGSPSAQSLTQSRP